MALPTLSALMADLVFVSQSADVPCSICFEPFEPAPLFRHGGDLSEEVSHRAVQTPCGHVFGEDCLEAWLGERESCPMCRTVLYKPENVEDDAEAEGDDYGADPDEEMVAVFEEMVELGIDLATRDSDNRVQLVQLFKRWRCIWTEQPEKVDELNRLWRSIVAITHARSLAWSTQDLNFDASDCRPASSGDIDRSALPFAGEEEKGFVVNAAEIEKALDWYFHRALESACFVYDHTRHRRARCGAAWSAVCHPGAWRLVQGAVSMVQGADGVSYSVRQLRGEVEDWVGAHLPREGRLDMVARDLVDVAVLVLCGAPVRLRVTRTVDRGSEWVTFGVEEPEIVNDVHEWLFSRG